LLQKQRLIWREQPAQVQKLRQAWQLRRAQQPVQQLQRAWRLRREQQPGRQVQQREPEQLQGQQERVPYRRRPERGLSKQQRGEEISWRYPFNVGGMMQNDLNAGWETLYRLVARNHLACIHQNMGETGLFCNEV
jgi:hypothetical protein